MYGCEGAGVLGEGVLLDGLKVVEWRSGGSEGVGYAVCMVWFE